MILSILFYVIAFVLWKKYPCLPYSCWRPQISPTQQQTLQNSPITAHPIHIPCCLTIQATWKCMSISINHAYHSKSNLPRHNITSNSAGIQNTPSETKTRISPANQQRRYSCATENNYEFSCVCHWINIGSLCDNYW